MHRMMLFGLGMAIAVPATAQTQAVQLRVAVEPNAGDPAWKTAGVKFEKRGECFRLRTRPSMAWPPVPGATAGAGAATAPLFNPGFPKPDGSYAPNSADDSFNTIFLPMTDLGGGMAMVCRGTILANGKDVTLRDSKDVSARTYESIGSLGPMGVAVQVDPRRLAAATNVVAPPVGGVKIGANTAVLKLKQGFDPDTGKIVAEDAPGAFRLYGTGSFLVYNLPAKMASGTVTPSGKQKCQTYVYAWTHKEIEEGGKPTEFRNICFKTGSGRAGEITNIKLIFQPAPKEGWVDTIIFNYVIW